MSVKKVSVDLWGTLLKSSPYFLNAKSNLIRRFLNRHLTDFEIEKIYRITKLQLNEIIEVTGWQPPQDTMFQLLLSNLTKKKDISFPWIGEFMHKYQELALNFKPKLYDDNTFRALELIHASDFELVLSSNTMFVDGKTLEKILIEMGIAEYFKKMLFSSEIGFSKPHRSMYDGSDYHIGDNYLTDYVGAYRAGSKGILINSNKETLHDAYYILIQK